MLQTIRAGSCLADATLSPACLSCLLIDPINRSISTSPSPSLLSFLPLSLPYFIFPCLPNVLPPSHLAYLPPSLSLSSQLCCKSIKRRFHSQYFVFFFTSKAIQKQRVQCLLTTTVQSKCSFLPSLKIVTTRTVHGTYSSKPNSFPMNTTPSWSMYSTAQ